MVDNLNDVDHTPSLGWPYTPDRANVRNTNARNFKCPRCGGEFNGWHWGGEIGKTKMCPFCNLVKGEYDPTMEQNDVAHSGER